MLTSPFNQAVLAFEALNYVELKRANQLIKNRLSEDEMGQLIAEKESSVDFCPYCECEHFIKWGASKQGKQRFKCKACLKTFNALAGTPLYRMKKPQEMLDYGHCMDLTISLRECARELDINLKTAFYWRHKLLLNPLKNKPSELLGIVEADETFVVPSNKGKRGLKTPRKHGGEALKKVPVLIALDRNGAVTHTVMDRNTKEELTNALAPVLSPGSVLCTDGNLSYIEVVKSLNFEIEHKRLIADKNKKAKIDGIYSIQRLNNYMMNWKRFMKKFRGVATQYLDRYLSWFREGSSQNCNCWIATAIK